MRSLAVVLSSVQEGLSHPVDVLAALVLSLAHVDVGYYLLPSRLLVELGPVGSDLLLLADIVGSSLLLFLLLLVTVLLELPPPFLLSLFLVLPLLVLTQLMTTLFSRRTVCILSYYYRILRVTSSSSKSLKSLSLSTLLPLFWGYQL